MEIDLDYKECHIQSWPNEYGNINLYDKCLRTDPRRDGWRIFEDATCLGSDLKEMPKTKTLWLVQQIFSHSLLFPWCIQYPVFLKSKETKCVDWMLTPRDQHVTTSRRLVSLLHSTALGLVCQSAQRWSENRTGRSHVQFWRWHSSVGRKRATPGSCTGTGRYRP